MGAYESGGSCRPRDIANKVYAIVSEELMVKKAEITDESSFIEDLGGDSIDAVDLIFKFEEEFGLEISDEDAEKISTVGKAIAYISKLLGVQQPLSQT